MALYYTYDENPLLRNIIHWITDIIVVIAFAWFVVNSFMNQTVINGHSMSPTLGAEDMCLINKLAYDFGDPKRFDIVVFEKDDSSRLNVKRIVGLPGETIQILGGEIYINNYRLDTDGRIGNIALPGIAENPVVLADDEYFLIGDNTDSSEDSRFSNIGNVKRENIKGKIWFRLRPLSRLGPVR